MSAAAAMRAVVSGRVQGVFFRSFVVEHARRLDLSGYVRNLPGGEVEVFAEGDRAALEKLTALLEVGPPDALVRDVAVSWSPFTGGYSGFRVSY